MVQREEALALFGLAITNPNLRRVDSLLLTWVTSHDYRATLRFVNLGSGTNFWILFLPWQISFLALLVGTIPAERMQKRLSLELHSVNVLVLEIPVADRSISRYRR